MYELAVRHIFGPALDFYRGARALKLREEFERTQWWPRQEIMALQDERLGKLLRYAYDNVPYYQRIFEQHALKPDDIQNSAVLVKLPVLTRQLFRDNFSDLIAGGFPKRELKLCSTSGSTGEPLRFYRAKDDICSWDCAAGLRASAWAGYELGKKCALLSAILSESESTVDKLARTSKHFFERITPFDVREMSEDKLPLFAKRLEGFQGGFIRGYPSAIHLLARYIERKGMPKIRPKAIIPSGEGLYDFQRALFAKVFECEVFSYYRSMEVNAIACECSEHSGFHISAENVILEIVDDEGKPLPAGEEGRILLTNLHSYGMPFIRYEMGDVGVISDVTCRCGRGLPLLAALNGRVTDIVYTKSGKCIPGLALPLNFFASLGVAQFQVVQDTYEKVAIRIVLGGKYPQERVDRLVNEIILRYRAVLGQGMEIEVELVDQVVPTQSGKRRIVISNVPERF